MSTTNFASSVDCLVKRIERCANVSLPFGDRLLATVAAIAEAADMLPRLERLWNDISTQSAKMSRKFPDSSDRQMLNLSSERRGWSYGRRDSQSITVNEMALTSMIPSPDEVATLKRSITALRWQSERFGNLLSELATIRDSLIERQSERINEQQADLLSVLVALEPGDRWQNRRASMANVNAFSGDAMQCLAVGIDAIQRAERGTLNVKTRKRGRVSNAAGERQITSHRWRSYNVLNKRADGSGQTFDHLQYGQTSSFRLSRWQKIQHACETHCQQSRDLAEKYQELKRLLVGQYGSIDLKMVFAYARMRQNQTYHELRSFKILAASSSSSRHGASGFITSRPIPDGEVEFTTQSGEFLILPILSWQVVDTDCGRSTEYALANHEAPVMEDILPNVTTYHVVNHTEDTAVSVATTFASRLAESERRASYYRDSRLRQESQRVAQRRRTATYARRLTQIPEVTLQDSYDVGNCKPGTKQFKDRLNVTSNRISGVELVRKWRSAGWPDDSLFNRVIDSLYRDAVTE